MPSHKKLNIVSTEIDVSLPTEFAKTHKKCKLKSASSDNDANDAENDASAVN